MQHKARIDLVLVPAAAKSPLQERLPVAAEKVRIGAPHVGSLLIDLVPEACNYARRISCVVHAFVQPIHETLRFFRIERVSELRRVVAESPVKPSREFRNTCPVVKEVKGVRP